MKLIYIAVMALFALTIGCNKSTSNRSNSTTTTYYWNGSACYSSYNNQVVAANLCSQTACNTTVAGTNNGYYRVNNLCYSSYTGQTVADTYCAQACTNGINGAVSMQCIGQYMYNGRQVTCATAASYATTGYSAYGANVYNCAGYQVQEVTNGVLTGRTVTCL